MNTKSIDEIQQEAFEHLLQGRFRLALPLAAALIKERSNNSETSVCYAWALLENNDPVNAERFVRLSEEQPGNSILARTYRAYLQMRLCRFEGAIYDFNMTEGKQKELLAWTYLNKAKSLAAIGEAEKASKFFALALIIDNNANPEWKKLKTYFEEVTFIQNKNALNVSNAKKYIDLCCEGLKKNEYWFSLILSKALAANTDIAAEFPDVKLLEVEAMFKMNQFQPLSEKIETLKKKFPDNEKLIAIERAAANYKLKGDNKSDAAGKPAPAVKPANAGMKTLFYQNKYADVFSVKLFDFLKNENDRVFYSSINKNEIGQIGIEIIFNNLCFQKNDQLLKCFLAWYLDDDLIDQLNFNTEVPRDWDAMIINRGIDIKKNHFWHEGEARVEFYINKEKAAEKSFSVSLNSIEEIEARNEQDEPASENEEVDIKLVLDELNSIIGLQGIKNAVRDLIDYLEFTRERKQLGLKSEGQVTVHSLFLGNPGTGKTTVARLMGKIFKGMGLLSKGNVIEVDRSALVGQYVGETAQKTEKIIEQAIGNVLFIDEAYTLVKKEASNDFGREAIEVLLKRMEDKKGEFFVIAAGYPKEMQDFLDANPGLKSRFTHNFTFEDYMPEELLEIFKKLVKDEDYRLTDEAEKILLKELINLYRARDKNFGNARAVRKIFEDAKLEVSKKYLALPKHQKTQEKLTTIYPEYINAILKPHNVSSEVKLPVNEELLKEALEQLENLKGLVTVKKDIREMVKLAKYYNETGENIRDKFNSHILFLGSPGTGKTTAARIVSKIYTALAILPNGQLIETDRSGLVAGYVGQTTAKTTGVINSSIGGTLFIDEAYALVKGGDNDFGKEAIDTLLKRMEDDRGKFIVIAAGYTDEMKAFLESNPGLKSRFTKTFFFEDYTPDELMEIFISLCKKDALRVDDRAKITLSKYFNSIYRSRDKNFGNARVVRNIYDSANKKRLLRLTDITPAELTDELKTLFIADDFSDICQKETASRLTVVHGDKDKLEGYINELNNLTGLKQVKEGVVKLVSSLKIAQVRRERGLEVISKPLHSVFTGNPGTGKTTVARIMANIYKELGVVEKGHLIEVDRAQLVAGYSGQTAIKTDEVIKKALGGMLFIDEAYTLSRRGGDFGQEAIDTLLKRMEDYKGQFIVIAAGYTNEMKMFLESNPGLTSRFSNSFHFDDYNPEQLTSIAESMAKESGYYFDEDAKSILNEKFTALYEKRDMNFGNARTARNILLDIITNQEARIANIINPSNDDLQYLRKMDIGR